LLRHKIALLKNEGRNLQPTRPEYTKKNGFPVRLRGHGHYVPHMTQTHILYLQLPLLDNDTQNARENFPFAGAYLDHALQRSPESAFHISSFSPTRWDELDTHHLAEAILATDANIVACTLYLWNFERTLRLAALLKKKNPALNKRTGSTGSVFIDQ
jgi:hypothetical protein